MLHHVTLCLSESNRQVLCGRLPSGQRCLYFAENYHSGISKKYRHEHFWWFWITECVIWSFLIQECMSSDRVEREVFQIGYLPLQRGISNLRHSYSSSRSLTERISMALVIKIKTFQEHLLMQTRIIQNHHVTNKSRGRFPFLNNKFEFEMGQIKNIVETNAVLIKVISIFNCYFVLNFKISRWPSDTL